MRHSVLLLTVVLGGLATAPLAFAQSSGVTSSGGFTSSGPGLGPLGSFDMKGKAATFAQQMSTSNMFEIAASQIAGNRSQRRDVREFAQMLVIDQTRATALLKEAFEKSNLLGQLPSSFDAVHAQWMVQLQNASRDEFDNLYMAAQLEDHVETVRMLQDFSLNGDNPALMEYARDVLPMVQRHLSIVQQMETPVSAAR